MSTYRMPVAIGVFRRDEEAKSAIDALRNAGFQRDQIGFARHEESTANFNYLNDLIRLGIPRERAQYYDSEFRAGNPVVSVRTEGRDQEVHAILHRFGGYDYEHRQGTAPGSPSDPSTYSQQSEVVQPSSGAQQIESDQFYTMQSEGDQQGGTGQANPPAQSSDSVSVDDHQDTVSPQQYQAIEQQDTLPQNAMQANQAASQPESVPSEQANASEPVQQHESPDAPQAHTDEPAQPAQTSGTVQAGSEAQPEDTAQQSDVASPPAQSPESTQQPDNAPSQVNDEQRIPLREERLQVEKQPGLAGEVRLRKEIVSEQQNIDVPILCEEIVIERLPGSGRVSDTPIGQEEHIRIAVHEEQVKVTKIPVETGEIAISKRVVQENRPISETVRHEEPRLETDGNPVVHSMLNAESGSTQSDAS